MATQTGSASISTTELSIPAAASYGGTPSQTTHKIIQLYVRIAALALGDVFEVRQYATINGTAVLVWSATITYGEPGCVLPSTVVSNGWDLTWIKITGTDRTGHFNLEHLTVT